MRVHRFDTPVIVTSYAEVWIEINSVLDTGDIELVTSYAEVWIEIGQPAR